MNQNNQIWLEWPKFLMNDLKQCKRVNNENWTFNIKGQYDTITIDKTISFNKVYIQGFIEQKPCDDVMILRDFTGRVKLSNCCSAVVQNDNNIVVGSYCSVSGLLLREKGLPQISAHKLIKIDNPTITADCYYNNWRYEVTDFKLFILGVIKPNL